MRIPPHHPCGQQGSTRRTLLRAIGATVTVSAAVFALVTPAAAADAAPHLPSSNSGGAAGPDDATTHAGATTAQERNRINAYWSPERMKLAGAVIPEITPIPKDDDTPDDPRPLPANTPDAGSVWTHGGAVEKNVGRLFFTFSDGYDGSCTATVVTSANRSTVLTAAHCLRGVGAPSADDTWNHNFYFVPGYRNGTKPLGGFSLRTMATSSRWDADPDTTESSDVAAAGYDAGLLVANPAAGGHPIADITGSQHIGFGQPVEDEFVHALGYPSNGLNDPKDKYVGSRMIHCAGPSHPGPKVPLLWGETCDMSAGSSGGPHLANFNTRSGTGTVVGITTTTEELAGGPTHTLYATRLGDSAHRLYDWAQSR
ncbi:trypsin-like serine peptidase [Streptomyces sp. NPDC088348]|uniref:trypsin-like serine peptidase n=1 Tax=Streptomyces sp. NPDC088348 TaxID=3365853 RepID=UPI00381C87AC